MGKETDEAQVEAPVLKVGPVRISWRQMQRTTVDQMTELLLKYDSVTVTLYDRGGIDLLELRLTEKARNGTE